MKKMQVTVSNIVMALSTILPGTGPRLARTRATGAPEESSGSRLLWLAAYNPSPVTASLREETRVSYLKRFLREESGQDMVEYGLLAAFISIVAIATLRAIGPLVDAIYQNIQAALTT